MSGIQKIVLFSVSNVIAIAAFGSFSLASAQTMCTMDAMQCSDGSYVGRTGPNCEFVCPGDDAVSADGSVNYQGGGSVIDVGASVDGSAVVGSDGYVGDGSNAYDGGNYYPPASPEDAGYSEPSQREDCTTNWIWINPCPDASAHTDIAVNVDGSADAQAGGMETNASGSFWARLLAYFGW